jgi:hypothetical protein
MENWKMHYYISPQFLFQFTDFCMVFIWISVFIWFILTPNKSLVATKTIIRFDSSLLIPLFIFAFSDGIYYVKIENQLSQGSPTLQTIMSMESSQGNTH